MTTFRHPVMSLSSGDRGCLNADDTTRATVWESRQPLSSTSRSEYLERLVIFSVGYACLPGLSESVSTHPTGDRHPMRDQDTPERKELRRLLAQGDYMAAADYAKN